MYSPTLILALQNEMLRAETLATLTGNSDSVQWTQGDPRQWTALLEEITSSQPDALLLDVANLDGDLGAALRQVRFRSPQTKVVALHAEADSASILTALRAGASEFIHPPFSESLFPALARLQSSVHQDSGRRNGKVIAFLSAKGGCGSTTLACHIAPELQRQTNGDVLLVDLDFTSGVVGFLMKSACSYSILDAIKNLSRLDESLWRAIIDRSRPKLAVLPAPSSTTVGDYPFEDDFKQVLRFMRTQHDWTVIDLGRSLTRTARLVLDEVDELFLVSTLEVIALHGVKSILRGISDDDAVSKKVQLVLNRTPKMMDITIEELQNILGKPLYATLPNDYPALYDSYSSGTLLPAKSRLAEHFARLAGRVAGTVVEKPSKKKFALFG